MKKIEKLAWPLFAPVAFILWTIDYYLVYFGLSLFFYKLTEGNNLIKIILLLLILPTIFFVARLLYDTTFVTAYLATKNKIIYFLFAIVYSLNRAMSVVQYCSVKPLSIPNSVVMQIPCYVNLFITFGQIILIFGLGLVFTITTREKQND